MEIKRNNPGNIRKVTGQTWLGELPGTVAPNFISFDTLANGMRAMIKLLNVYVNSGFYSISKIISRWAPPSDNNPTEAYIKFVSDKTGIDPNKIIAKDDYNTLGKIAIAMTYMEHGIKADDGTLATAVTKAKEILTGVIETATTAVKNNPGTTLIIVAAVLFLILSD